MSAINQHTSRIDRAGELRVNQESLDQLWQRAQILQIAEGRIAAVDSKLSLINAKQVAAHIAAHTFTEGSRYFLGLDLHTKAPFFAWDTEWVGTIDDEVKEVGFSTVREIGSLLSEQELEISLHAMGLSNWHRAHPRCPRCGGATRVDLGGAARTCDADGSQHHPRTDSAVIVLVKDRDDRILLGHQPIWPEGRFSTFAGFLEPGETFEQCVAREVLEESAVVVTELNYLGSQPWPFPASIMIAFEAVTDNPERAQGDGQEITEVKWFTRAQLLAAAKDGSLLLPPSISVARKMIERWLGESAPGGQTWR
ncbi:NAD(+) diphosphatase [Candidatus Planktophila versatilis]|uniref:NAD(+) diphosphatase n=1 Tax=Candidatus Planktophila versatilis TaxID=1884905 RepID=UPI000BAC5C3F|nr:NAD(+) diphosphatase [Candidatus Planktophila versatilis]ASY25975.1 NAD+ diphosphatase [Candidatus Planktophila versatilis]